MRSRTRLVYALLLLSLLHLSGGSASGRAKPGAAEQNRPVKGIRIERIEQKRTEAIAWLRVQVLADTGPAETWSVLQDVEGWGRFLHIFSSVAPVETAGPLTLYRMAVSPPWPIHDFDSLIWIAKLPEYRLLLWRADKDDLAKSHGRIKVEGIPGGTRVSYEMHSPAKGAFPPWVVKIGLYLVLPRVAHDFYDRIREQESDG